MATTKGKKKGKKNYLGRVYLGRGTDGKQLFEFVGWFELKRERDDAVAERKVELRKRGQLKAMYHCDKYVERYLKHLERRVKLHTYKDSSLDTQTDRLARFRVDFAERPMNEIGRAEAKDWINGEGMWAGCPPVPVGYIQAVVTLFNYAINEDDLDIDKSPFRGLGHRYEGRRNEAPPSPDEYGLLLDACDALGDYGPKMRAMFEFATWSLYRPSELYALIWPWVLFDEMDLLKEERYYRGKPGDPKTGKVVVPLPGPARDAIIGLPREHPWVFGSKRGRRMSQSSLSQYWAVVCAAAGIRYDFYHATKHYGVHFLWTKLKLSDRAIAAQAGWEVAEVQRLLRVYGHANVGAREEVKRAYAENNVTHLGVTPKMRDMTVIPGGQNVA